MLPRGAALELKGLVRRYGRPYSAALGIDLRSRQPGDLSKWFLASMLYAKPIREEAATRTYKIFEAEGRTTPRRIVEAGWEGVVGLLDAGGYVRYDFSTADKLLGAFGALQARYGGDLNRLHAAAKGSGELERLLEGLGKGIGDVTVAIFLRDLLGIWPKARPGLTPLERLPCANWAFRNPQWRPLPGGCASARFACGRRWHGTASACAAAKAPDRSPRAVNYPAVARHFCRGMAAKIVGDAVVMLGGYGHLREYPPEKMYRDVKALQIYEGMNHIQRVVIARHLLGAP